MKQLMKSQRQISNHAQTINFADGTNVCTYVVPVLGNVCVPQSTMQGTRTSDSTSPRNKHVGKSYREICMWSWTQVVSTKVLLLKEVRKERMTMSNPVNHVITKEIFRG
jgi:hypothetical protein